MESIEEVLQKAFRNKVKHQSHKEDWREGMDLRELRMVLNKTQMEMAAAGKMAQCEISKVESGSNHRVSTLRRYIAALGGELEIFAVFGRKHKVRLRGV